VVVRQAIREQIAAQMPEPRVSGRFSTFPSAYNEIRDAAFNRRMIVADYVGRAAAAFAVFDSQGEVNWEELMEKEPPISDLVRGGFAKERLRGGGHGEWQIRRLR
jgi:hypothetical protein